MKYEYGKKFHGYEYYTHNVEKILNNYCKNNGYEFSISTGYGREISYAILDGCTVITQIKYNHEWNRWLFYYFEFHIDVEDIIDWIKRPVIHFSNDGRIECNEDKVIELFEERKKILELYRSKKEEVKAITKKIAKYSEIQCIGLNEKIVYDKNYIKNNEE